MGKKMIDREGKVYKKNNKGKSKSGYMRRKRVGVGFIISHYANGGSRGSDGGIRAVLGLGYFVFYKSFNVLPGTVPVKGQ